MALPPSDEPSDPGSGEGIPVVEERVRIATRPTETGRVQVRLATEEVEEVVRATLRGRRASVERIAIDREVTEPPQVRQEGDLVVVPVVEEVLVVERRLRLREEIRIRFEATEENVAVPVRRRVQRAEIRRRPARDGADTPGSRDSGNQETHE